MSDILIVMLFIFIIGILIPKALGIQQEDTRKEQKIKIGNTYLTGKTIFPIKNKDLNHYGWFFISPEDLRKGGAEIPEEVEGYGKAAVSWNNKGYWELTEDFIIEHNFKILLPSTKEKT